MPRNLSNRNELLAGPNAFIRLAQSSNVYEVLEYFTLLATEKRIHLCSVRFKRGKLEREFNLPNAGSVTGKTKQLAVPVEGGNTHLVVTFRDPMDCALMRELEYAAHLAAHRIEFLARGDLRTVDIQFGMQAEEDVDSTDDVCREMYLEQMHAPKPWETEYIPVLREGETLKEFLGRIILEIYERELSRSGSHSAAARRLGMKRTTLYDWLEWARKLVTMSEQEVKTPPSMSRQQRSITSV